MKFYNANIADVLRLSQRDEAFLHDTEENLQAFFKLLGPRNSHKLSKNVATLASIWYYFMTSLGNLQTLGEEYSGTIRLDTGNKIPTKLVRCIYNWRFNSNHLFIVDSIGLVNSSYWWGTSFG